MEVTSNTYYSGVLGSRVVSFGTWPGYNGVHGGKDWLGVCREDRRLLPVLSRIPITSGCPLVLICCTTWPFSRRRDWLFWLHGNSWRTSCILSRALFAILHTLSDFIRMRRFKGWHWGGPTSQVFLTRGSPCGGWIPRAVFVPWGVPWGAIVCHPGIDVRRVGVVVPVKTAKMCDGLRDHGSWRTFRKIQELGPFPATLFCYPPSQVRPSVVLKSKFSPWQVLYARVDGENGKFFFLTSLLVEMLAC